jgi:hypothetical protein
MSAAQPAEEAQVGLTSRLNTSVSLVVKSCTVTPLRLLRCDVPPKVVMVDRSALDRAASTNTSISRKIICLVRYLAS